jgi:hypothetical protein
VTSLLDLSTSSTWPISSGGFGDIYKVKLHDSTEVAVKTTRIYVNSTTEGQKHLKVSDVLVEAGTVHFTKLLEACSSRTTHLVEMPPS